MTSAAGSRRKGSGWVDRIQGALKNLDHRVARSTIARVLKEQGIPPVPDRPTSWRTFLRANWGKIAAADFFTTEVWTARGLVTYYTLFVLDLCTRRVHVAGSTPHPDQAFMTQAARRLTDAVDGFLVGYRALICDRDTKWMDGFRRVNEDAGVRIVQTPIQAPNANAYAERFVRSIREECLDRLRHRLRPFKDHDASAAQPHHWHRPASSGRQGLAKVLNDSRKTIRSVCSRTVRSAAPAGCPSLACRRTTSAIVSTSPLWP
jgi:transposase InsO family protein